MREGNVGAPVHVGETTVAVDFNDVDALDRALATGEIAVVLAEPAMTNMGIILPDDGYMTALRELTRRHGTLLIIDETHTFSAGPGGCTQAWDLDPDILVIGKAIAGGVPAGAMGITEDLVERLFADEDADYEDTGGVGGTLAGNALSSAAMRATLEHTLHAEAFSHTIPLATRFAQGVQGVIDAHELPWNVSQLGCRAEYQFLPEPASNGTVAAAAHDEDLEHYLHLHALNRGVMITPFHNMALMCPQSSEADVDRHTEVFAEAAARPRGVSCLCAQPAHRRSRSPHRRRAHLGHRPLQLPLSVLHARRGPAVARAQRGPELRGDRARRRAAGADGRARRAPDRRRAARPPRLPAAGGDARAGPRRRGPLRHDQRLPAGRATPRRSSTPGCSASTCRSTRSSATASSR